MYSIALFIETREPWIEKMKKMLKKRAHESTLFI